MARAEAASASTRSDSIKGLAQSIAKPAYRRLLIAEPALRRAVPALIIAFLLTIGVGAIVQVLDHRRQVMIEAISELETMADFVAERLERLASEAKLEVTPRSLLARATLPRTTDFGRRVVLSNSDGIIVATSPEAVEQSGRRLLDVLGDAQPLTILGASAGVLEITLANGTRALATVRTLTSWQGQLALLQPRADALSVWRSERCYGDVERHHRLRAADPGLCLPLAGRVHGRPMFIYDTVRSRIDTALNRGRCGLWDWDLGRPHLLVAFDVRDAGSTPKNGLLTFGGEQARAPRDIELYQVAVELADQRSVRSIMTSACCTQTAMDLAAGALRGRAPTGRARPASDRHRGRHHRAEDFDGKDCRCRFAAARCDRDHPGSLRAVGCRKSPGAVQLRLPSAA
jgi:two-component system cell cycle sensor histidine kinase PleC